MSLQLELRRDLDSMIVPHDKFAHSFDRLQRLLEDHDAGVEPGIELLVGPSRIGKSEILQKLAAKYPASRENGRLVKPVLIVAVPTGTAPKDLPISVMQALGVPIPKERSRTNVLFGMMIEKLQLAKTMAILFDETSHLVDVGSRIPPRQASDWFKGLFDSARISIVMSGVPRLTRLLESNEQLRGRCQRPLELMPYRWDRRDERLVFAGCAQAFLKVFEKHGCLISVPWNSDILMRHLYAVSTGNIGALSHYFKALAREVRQPGPLDLQSLKHASTKVNLPAHGLLPPFECDTMPDEHLLQLLMTELATYDISLPIESPHAKLAAHRHRNAAVPA